MSFTCTMLGMMRPMYEMDPTVETTAAVMRAAMIRPQNIVTPETMLPNMMPTSGTITTSLKARSC